MAHKVKVSGTVYEVKGGKCKVSGTAYDIKKGKTKVGGTSYDISFIPPLNEHTWAEISDISASGQAANYFSVGDTKTITINGTVGNTNFSNLSIDVFILGFDHNSAIEGSNRIHFQIGKINGLDIALCDGQYGYGGSASGYFKMNTSKSNNGGWKSCHMRTLLGNGSDNSPEGSLRAALPSDLQAVMKAVTKYSDNVGGGTDNASSVTATKEYLWLPSLFEVFGKAGLCNTTEQNYQKQYDYYKAGNSTIKRKHNDITTWAVQWLRSSHRYSFDSFCSVSTGGSADSRGAYFVWSIAPCFAV